MTHRKRRTSNIVECRSNSWRFIFHLEPSCLSSVKLPSSCPSNPHMSHTMSILPLPQEPNLPKKNMATSEFSKRFGGESSSVFFHADFIHCRINGSNFSLRLPRFRVIHQWNPRLGKSRCRGSDLCWKIQKFSFLEALWNILKISNMPCN